jgi:hypothetical protein
MHMDRSEYAIGSINPRLAQRQRPAGEAFENTSAGSEPASLKCVLEPG